MERIEEIEVRDETFEIPAGFNPSEQARGAFGIAAGKPEPVEIAFDGEVANYIRERVWHESQEILEGKDGSVKLRMNVAPGFELKSWIKGSCPTCGSSGQPPCARRSRELEQASKSFAGK